MPVLLRRLSARLSDRQILCSLACFLAFATLPVSLLAQIAVTTQHNDNYRTGANPNETILNTSNVNANTFGKLFSLRVDGMIYAQPLYVPNVPIPGLRPHNVLFVCTEHNTVYAFDADSRSDSPLWSVNLGPSLPASVISSAWDIVNEIGITSTPVIDLASSTIYVVAETYEDNEAIFRLHALDIRTGSEKFGGPAVIKGSVPGTSFDSSDGVLTFNPLMQWQRPGLLLWNGRIYIGFGSHQDAQPYHGWIFAYDAVTLQQRAIRCLTPNGAGAGVWQGGVGLTVDADGNIYVQTGHAEGVTEGVSLGDSLVKLSTQNDLEVVDYFSPSNRDVLDDNDVDFGSSGPILIPGTPYGVSGGKDGKLFLFDTANLGQFNPDQNQVVQWWQATNSLLDGGGFFAGNVFYDSTLYVWGRMDKVKAFAFRQSSFDTNPISQGTFSIPDGYSNEPAMSLSANGTTRGTAILWAAYSRTGYSDGYPYQGVLRAFDASDLTRELWNSEQQCDFSGSWAKWAAPTIANGKVYLATFDNVINVYGLLPRGGEGMLVGFGDSSSAPVNLTAEGPLDWVHWGDTNLIRKAGTSPLLSNYTAASPYLIPYSNDPRPISWTDGTPATVSIDNTNGVSTAPIDNGFSFTAPADTTTRIIKIHVGGSSSGGTLQACLSDGSARDFTDVTPTLDGQYNRNYTLTYRAGREAQTLNMRWMMTSGSGNVSLVAAALDASTDGANVVIAASGANKGTTLGTGPLQAGYAKATIQSGGPPYGVAVFSLRKDGTIVSEAGVPASTPTRSARLFIDYRTQALVPPLSLRAGPVDIATGIAIVNPGTALANITFTLHDTQGTVLTVGHGTLAAGDHRARYIYEFRELAPDFVIPPDFATRIKFGSLEIASDQPLSILALRLTVNQRSETLLTTIPVADMSQPTSSGPLFFPHIVDGGGFSTSVILLNTTNNTQSGTIRFYDESGLPFSLRSDGVTNSVFSYSIVPGATYLLQTEGTTPGISVGSAQLFPNAGSTSPVGAGVFSMISGGVLASESGIPSAIPTTHARVFVDLTGGHDSGLAIAATNATAIPVTLQAFQNDGITPVGNVTTRSLAGNGHIAAFASEFITNLPPNFVGVLDVSAPTAFVALTLRTLFNARNDFLMTTFPVADLASPAPPVSPLIFPQIADGGGFVTDYILISAGGASGASVSFLSDAGSLLAIGK